MMKDELLMRVSTKLPKSIVDELRKCDTLDEMVVILPGAVGREVVRQLREARKEE